MWKPPQEGGQGSDTLTLDRILDRRRTIAVGVLSLCLLGGVAVRPMPAEANSLLIAQSEIVPPNGWRHTTQGWERIEEQPGWAINYWIQIQEQEESANWCLGLFSTLAVVHPISFAAGQLAIAFLLASVTKQEPVGVSSV
ncbi:hypothetical protein FF011L_24270 [Roseimaritima multifibrata]|uniref:Uncharacterized protein n=1 Tax=Roseimaritima multifibrata TaxID=1930274 RepID=A0A517MFJ1_9BACT|nr:hypothetical protein [Roseimaritima multifibrata]QDS93654.1 hypothetical protein FF011L_24270 [Roseimaritima multifibrata]